MAARRMLGKLQNYVRAYSSKGAPLDVSQSLQFGGAFARFSPQAYAEVRDAVDWRTEGAVTRVKDQGKLGTCWAFATLGAVEGIHKLATGELIDLSAQELVDCMVETDDKICGNTTQDVLDFIIENGGVSSWEDYPYTEAYGECDCEKKKRKVATIDDYYQVPCDELSLQVAVGFQPIVVSIDPTPLLEYTHDILRIEHETQRGDLRHAVLVTGYGTDDREGDYWTIKNSHGEYRYEKGYCRIPRNVKWPGGALGIALRAFGPMKKEVKIPCVPDLTYTF